MEYVLFSAITIIYLIVSVFLFLMGLAGTFTKNGVLNERKSLKIKMWSIGLLWVFSMAYGVYMCTIFM